MNDDRLHPIADAVHGCGLSVSAVRFYSNEGLISPAGHNSAGHRLYTIDAIARADLMHKLASPLQADPGPSLSSGVGIRDLAQHPHGRLRRRPEPGFQIVVDGPFAGCTCRELRWLERCGRHGRRHHYRRAGSLGEPLPDSGEGNNLTLTINLMV